MKTTLRLLPLILGLALFTACEDEDGETGHKPPPGKGSIVVDNRSNADFNFYLDGSFKKRAEDGEETPVDLEPGVYRVVLEETDEDWAFRDEIDVLEDRNTIIEITDQGLYDFDVSIFYD